jgi:hypothetical protein
MHTTLCVSVCRLLLEMKLVDLVDNGSRYEGQQVPIHELSVDDAVCEILRSRPDIASDPPSLLSCGRSAHETAAPECHTGSFVPPADSKLHGAVGVQAGDNIGVIHGEVLCTPDRLILVAFANENAYRSLVAESGQRSQVQTALFADKRRALLFYVTLEEALRNSPSCPNTPFFVHIPNGLAFLRVCEANCHDEHSRNQLQTSEFTGLFRYYSDKPRPSLHFVIQVQTEAEPPPSSMAHPFNPASLEAMMTFFGNRRHSDTLLSTNEASSSSWSGSTEEGGTPTPSETATVVAECVQAVAVTPRSSAALRRLKRALE